MSEERNESRQRDNRPAREPSLANAGATGDVGAASAPGLSLDGPDGRHVRSPNRKPFGSMVQKLAVPPRPGFHRHWFNDEPGRVDMAKENGYNHVLNAATQKSIESVVNKDGQKAYLMEIPQEWFDEDMAAQQQTVDDKEETMRRGQIEAKNPRDREDHFRNTAQGRKIDIRTNAVRR